MISVKRIHLIMVVAIDQACREVFPSENYDALFPKEDANMYLLCKNIIKPCRIPQTCSWLLLRKVLFPDLLKNSWSTLIFHPFHCVFDEQGVLF